VVNSGFALPLWFAPGWVLAWFFKNPEEIAVATLPLQLVGTTGALAGIGLVLMNALLGAGDNRKVMAIATVLQWGLFLPLAYVIGVRAGQGLVAIMALQTLYGALFTVCFSVLWQRRQWQTIVL
jgi:multidrug resistance protein, MATE family